MAQLGPISAPEAGDSVLQLWKPVKALCVFINALLKLRIVPSYRNAFTITEGGAVLELNLGGDGGGAVIDYPWRPYPSTWKGSGDDPHASDRKQRFKLTWAQVNGREPENMPMEFVAPGGSAGVTIDNPVRGQVYLRIPTSESGLGFGDLATGPAMILVAEGPDLQTVEDYPVFGEDGALPAYVLYSICQTLWYDDTLHFLPGLFFNLDIALATSGVFSTGAISRNFIANFATLPS